MRVQEIWRFPVKSMQGERIDAAEVEAQGLRGDRAFALFDTRTGFGLTGRRVPQLLFAAAVYRDDVEPTNNSSERDLRNSVIHDKVTGGYRSRRGAEQGAVFATLLTTARKLGHNAYQRLCAIAGPSPLSAAGMAT